MKLLGSTEEKIDVNKSGENIPHLEITEVVLVCCNIAKSDYQHDSRVLYIFVPNKSFGQLLDISPKNLVFLKTFYSEFSYTESWFTDQNPKRLEIEDKVNITLVINESRKYKNNFSFNSNRDRIFVKGYRFLSFAKNIGKSIGKNISKNLSRIMLNNQPHMYLKLL